MAQGISGAALLLLLLLLLAARLPYPPVQLGDQKGRGVSACMRNLGQPVQAARGGSGGGGGRANALPLCTAVAAVPSAQRNALWGCGCCRGRRDAGCRLWARRSAGVPEAADDDWRGVGAEDVGRCGGGVVGVAQGLTAQRGRG